MSIEKDVVEVAMDSLTSPAIRKLAEKGLAEVSSRLVGVDKSLDENFRVDGRVVTILCGEDRQRYELSLSPRENHRLPAHVSFGGGVPAEVILTQVRGLTHPEGAIELREDGFSINLRRLRAGEQYLLSLDYDIPDTRFLDSLVDRVLPKDVPHRADDQNREYEFSAQLKFPQLFQNPNSRLSIRDIPLTVSVAVHQDVATAVPHALVQQLENLLNLSSPHGRSEMFRLAMRQYQLQQHKGGSHGLEILKSIREVFLPTVFQSFIEVLNDFSLDRCYRGKEFYDVLPFSSWPRDMKVVTTASLDYDHPLAEGKLVYRHSQFVERIQKALDTHRRPIQTKTGH